MNSNRFFTRVVPLALGLAALAAFFVVVLDRPPERSSPTRADAASHNDAASYNDAAHETEALIVRTELAPASASEGDASVSCALRGHVRDAHAQPVAGAEISWSQLIDEDFGVPGTWATVPRDEIDAATLSTTSDATGAFCFAVATESASPLGHCVSVTCPGFEASVRVLDPATDVLEVELIAASGLRVQVVDRLHQPVADARVQHHGLRAPDSLAWDRRYELAYRSFSRTQITDSAGFIEALSPLGAQQVVSCSHDGVLAQPWIGEAAERRADIRLVLLPAFAISGRVLFSKPPTDTQACSVIVSTETGSARRMLDQLRLRADGSIERALVPVVESATYQVRLRGGNWVSDVVTFATPESGGEISIELSAEPGIEAALEVRDQESRALVGAEVWIAWADGDSSNGVTGRTDRSGSALLIGCKPGMATVAAEMEGYRAHRREVELPAPDGEPFVLALERGGRITGVVRHAGAPVEDFSVAYWQHDLSKLTSEDFQSRRDGSFEIDSAPLGDVFLFASSERHPQSRLQSVAIRAGETTALVLELPAPILGRGRIVDALTRKPIERAWVEVYTTWGSRLVTRVGPRHFTDAAGEFAIESFAPGHTSFWAGANGYSNWLGSGKGVPGATLELGTIPIAPLQPLEVQLVADTPRDFSAFHVEARGSRNWPRIAFDESGRAAYAAADQSPYYTFWIDGPDGYTRTHVEYLRPGRDWHVVIPVAGQKRLEVTVERAADSPAIAGLFVSATFSGRAGVTSVAGRWLEDQPTAIFDDIDAARAIVQCVGGEGLSVLALEQVELKQPTTAVRLELGGRALRIRAIDRDERVLPGVEVGIGGLIGESRWSSYQRTDQAGECEFRGVALGAVLLHVFHTEMGSAYLELDGVPPGGETLVLRHDARARLRVRFVDGTTPLPSILARSYAEDGVWEMLELLSDQRGEVESRLVNEVPIAVEIDQLGIWSARATFTARESTEPHTLQLRRTASIVVQTRAASGAAVSNAAIELRSLEFGDDVAEWLASGRISASSSQMRTDLQGELHLDGLPNGDYAWTCAPAGGEHSTGTLSLAPGITTTFAVVVP